MPIRVRLVCCLAALAWVCPITAAADDWPQWRGPNQNGVSDATNLPLTWSDTENVIWKTALPYWSGGTPVISGDRIFLTSPTAVSEEDLKAHEEEQQRRAEQRQGRRRGFGSGKHPGGQTLLLLCLSRTSGEILWQRELDEGNRLWMKSNSASASPVTDGTHVWVMTGNGTITAFTMDGDEVWRKNLQDEYGQFGLNWGYASSPLLHDGKIVVQVLHGTRTDDPSYIVAFDAMSGEVAWRVERPTDAPMEAPDAYTTPLPAKVGGETHIVISGADYVTGHDPDTGTELWRVAGLNPRKARNYRIVPSPVYADGMIYAPTRIKPLLAIRTSHGAPTEEDLAWKWDAAGAPDVPTPACDGERFYMINDAGMVTCLDAKSGEAIWGPERTVQGNVSSSPVLADGRLYFINEAATTVVVSAGPEFEILATNPLDDSYTLASIVPAGDRLYIRTGSHLYCIGDSSTPSAPASP